MDQAAEEIEIVDGAQVPSFDDFVAAEQRPLLRLAWSLTRSTESAEDAVQETMLVVHRNWDRVAGYDKPGAYARRVLLNRLTSAARRRRAERRAIERLDRPQPQEDRPPPDSAFWVAVAALPARQCHSVVLHYVEDRSVADIAEILGVAEGTVKVHLHRGRRALAEVLGTDGRER